MAFLGYFSFRQLHEERFEVGFDLLEPGDVHSALDERSNQLRHPFVVPVKSECDLVILGIFYLGHAGLRAEGGGDFLNLPQNVDAEEAKGLK